MFLNFFKANFYIFVGFDSVIEVYRGKYAVKIDCLIRFPNFSFSTRNNDSLVEF